MEPGRTVLIIPGVVRGPKRKTIGPVDAVRSFSRSWHFKGGNQ